MSQIHIPKEVFDKLKDSPIDKNTAILLSKFNPERKEEPEFKDFKTKRKVERIREARKSGKIDKNDKDRVLYENGEITLEEYNERKLTKTAQSLASQLQKIRVKKGMEKPKPKKIKHVHVKGLGFSNHSVFRANDKDLWPYKK